MSAEGEVPRTEEPIEHESLPLSPAAEDVSRPADRPLSTRPAPPIDAPDLAPIPARRPREQGENQFSLFSLLILFTLLPLLLWPMGKLPRAEFAGIAGGLALFMLLIESITGSRHMLLRVGWWVLFAVYLGASLLAALGW